MTEVAGIQHIPRGHPALRDLDAICRAAAKRLLNQEPDWFEVTELHHPIVDGIVLDDPEYPTADWQVFRFKAGVT